MLNAAIIGFGNAGQRFFRAIDIINSRGPALNVKAIADINPELQTLRQHGECKFYDSYQDLLRDNQFDFIFIATNDNAHFGIFKFIAEAGVRFKKIICEKPLVNSVSEIAFLRDNFQPESIIVHFVERYSEACLALRRYIECKHRIVRRVSFDWSKFRLNDTRPTVGVFSEITHPLDLTLYLSNITRRVHVENISTWISLSDFHAGGLMRPDGITVTLDFVNGPLVTGSSSYLRSERTRKMEFILADEQGNATELAVLVFDKPRWDFDYLTLYDLAASKGQPVRVYEKSFTPEKGSEHGLSKICSFIMQVIDSTRGGSRASLASMEQGLFVQEIVLDMAASDKTAEQRLFTDIHNRPRNPSSDEHCYSIKQDENY